MDAWTKDKADSVERLKAHADDLQEKFNCALRALSLLAQGYGSGNAQTLEAMKDAAANAMADLSKMRLRPRPTITWSVS